MTPHNKENRGRKAATTASVGSIEFDVRKKMLDGFTTIPSFIFRDRSVAVLESLVEYMHDVQKLKYHEIAVLLNRNDRTIWTVYRRAKLKRKGLIRHKEE